MEKIFYLITVQTRLTTAYTRLQKKQTIIKPHFHTGDPTVLFLPEQQKKHWPNPNHSHKPGLQLRQELEAYVKASLKANVGPP